MNKSSWIMPVISFIAVGILLGYGLWFAFVDTPKQMDILLEILETNQTHVDSLPCENIELAIASGYQQMALNPPIKLIEKLKEIAKEKECQFQRPDLWLDGYEPNKITLQSFTNVGVNQ